MRKRGCRHRSRWTVSGLAVKIRGPELHQQTDRFDVIQWCQRCGRLRVGRLVGDKRAFSKWFAAPGKAIS